MSAKTLNQVLADNLLELKGVRWKTAKALGESAQIAGNTVANYLKAGTGAEHQYKSTKGKENSATLSNVERLAAALDLPPALLLLDATERKRLIASALKLEADLAEAQCSAEKRRPALEVDAAADPDPEGQSKRKGNPSARAKTHS